MLGLKKLTRIFQYIKSSFKLIQNKLLLLVTMSIRNKNILTFDLDSVWTIFFSLNLFFVTDKYWCFFKH